MTVQAFFATVVSPLRDSALLLAAFVFWLMGAIGLFLYDLFAGFQPLLGLLGLLLMFAAMVPALLGYLLQVVDARARKVSMPVADIELFILVGSGWRLFPVLFVAGAAIAVHFLAAWSPWLAAVVGLLIAAMLLPLHFMLLAETASRWQSVNPLAMQRLLWRLWPEYLWLWPATLLLGMAAWLLWQASLSQFLQLAGFILLALSAASTWGAVLSSIDVMAETDIPAPAAATDAELRAVELQDRQQVLNHAYGMISRGNREGGFAHIEQMLTAGNLDTSKWFFFAMLRWDIRDAPLYFAQRLLTRLLDAGDDAAAMKILLSCLHRNANFRPLPADRGRLLAAASRQGNGEVLQALGRMP